MRPPGFINPKRYQGNGSGTPDPTVTPYFSHSDRNGQPSFQRTLNPGMPDAHFRYAGGLNDHVIRKEDVCLK